MKHPYRSRLARPVRLPVRLRLPSGARVSVRASERPRQVRDALRPAADEGPAGGRPAAAPTLLGAYDALDGGAVEVLSEQNGRVPIAGLSLEDFHVLRALVTRAGLLDEGPEPVECSNCGHRFRVRPCEHVEFGPFLDDELDDPELDEPFDFATAHPLPPVRLPGGGEASEVRLAPREVGQARPLHEALGGERLTFTGDVVRAMGVEGLGPEGDADAIAAALEGADDEARSALFGLFDEAHYPPRLRAPVRCGRCGALERVDAPGLREFPAEVGARPRRGEAEGGFLSERAFAELARRAAGEIFARRGAPGVELAIETGPAACDDGGVTLLGSYVPGEPARPGEAPARAPEVTLYYRTFRAVHDDEGPFDVEAEIVETIEHELDHHEAFLRGEDPVDEEERGEIAREARREVGETETLRRASRALRTEAGDFLYRTWPFWLIVALLTYLLSR
ncbi:MAG TPA: hypothetical protein VFS43_23820 [Polyangiaceae bacterium]|nr:hypothetical protein [Polyangiaceae bacterium]